MKDKVALIGIMVNNMKAVDTLNAILHDYSKLIIGRMGLPYTSKNINIISIAIDAHEDQIHSLVNKIKDISGLDANVLFYDEKEN